MEGQIIVLLFAGLLLSFFVKKLLYTPKKLHKRIIEKINKKGYELVSIDTPKLFDTGPFPSVEFKVSFGSTKVLGISGEKNFYRVVNYRNKKGELLQTWVKIETYAFQVAEVTWDREI